MAHNTTQPGPAPELGRKPTRKTRTSQDSGRLPHEHDQSPDNQNDADREPPEVGKQAYRDVRDGLKDTDRGPVYDRMRKTTDQ